MFGKLLRKIFKTSPPKPQCNCAEHALFEMTGEADGSYYACKYECMLCRRVYRSPLYDGSVVRVNPVLIKWLRYKAMALGAEHKKGDSDDSQRGD
jgi:hypothetical protein